MLGVKRGGLMEELGFVEDLAAPRREISFDVCQIAWRKRLANVFEVRVLWRW